MRIALILTLITIAVPGFCEETKDANPSTWTYATGLKILSSKVVKELGEKSNWKIEKRGSNYLVTIYDYFFSEGNFEAPFLSLPREGKVTLTVSSKKQKLFKSKEEFPLQLSVEISGKRLHKGETIYFLNGDYGEVKGHQLVR